jgi:uncharacterized protein YtpQ (UPF0354 family)
MRSEGHDTVIWTKRMMLATVPFLSIFARFKKSAAAGKRRFMDIQELRNAVTDIVGRNPGVTSATPDASDPAKINIRAGGQTYTADLTNLLNRILAYPDDDPDQLIAQFTASMSDMQNRSASEENLVAVLRDKSYVDRISKMAASPLIEPLVGDLTIVYVADLPGSISVAAQNEFPGKNLAEVRRVALSNVRKWLRRVKSDDQLQGATLYFVEDNTMLSPSLILLSEFWASITDRHPGDVLIAVPRRDQLFILDDDVRGRALARRLIDVTFQDNLSLLSDKIYARRNGNIVLVTE